MKLVGFQHCFSLALKAGTHELLEFEKSYDFPKTTPLSVKLCPY